jgi:hypothetical protein
MRSAYQENRPTNSTRSEAQKLAHQPQRTAISAKNGSSHSVYCGECTLLSSRNAQSIAPDTCTHG